MEARTQAGVSRIKVKLSWRECWKLLRGREVETSLDSEQRVAIKRGAWPRDVFRSMSPLERRRTFIKAV